jgi:N-acetylmuramoyl-L-alanine amidase
MMTTRFKLALFAAVASTAIACAPSTTGTTTAPTPVPTAPVPPPVPAIERAPLPVPNPGLPPVPTVNGPLAIKVIYPDSGHLIQSKDSNFILGSVGNGDAALSINGISAPVWPNGSFMAWLPNPPADSPRYDIVAVAGSEVARLTVPVKIQPRPTVPPLPDTITPLTPAQYATLIGPAVYASDTDRVITGYALEGGIQRWFLMPNTVVKVTGTKGSDTYVQLDSAQTVRIDKGDVKYVDSTFAPVARTASAFKLQQGADDWTDVVIPITDKPAYYVDEGPSGMTLILYGTSGPKKSQLPVKASSSSYIKTVAATSNGPEMRYALDLKGPVYGYLALWQPGTLTFRVRRPPKVDPANPLMGRTIAIDPGHPPIGARGPTGLWEPEATLPVGFKVQELLQAKGVKVIMTRTSPAPVDLYVRPAMARRENAEAFVSIHLNAVGDGQNPFRAQGTTTYHYYPHSETLADSVDRTAAMQLALPDKGVKRENFAVIRGTWMPSILVEGAFIIMPDQEAALRTPEYQLRYAQGIVDGLENYFRGLAQQQR